MSDSVITLEYLQKVLEILELQRSQKRPRHEGRVGRLRRSKSADSITSLVKNETEISIACMKLREITENNVKGFQKLREKLKDIARKLVEQKMSVAKVSGIYAKKEGFQCTRMEWKVMAHNFRERYLIGNTTFGNACPNFEEEVTEDIIAKQLPNEASIIELIMECQKSAENEGEWIDQIMRELEHVDRIIETNDIPTKRKWACDIDQCSSKDLELLTDDFSEENYIGDTTYGKLYRGKLKLDSTGSETRNVVVKIWDDKVNRIDDGKVVKEEVTFLAYRKKRNLPKVMWYCNDADYSNCDTTIYKWWNGVVYDINNPLDRLYNYIPKDEFSWIQRMKVAFELAMLLQYLHLPDRPYVLFNWDTKNILLNQDYSPIVVDFGLLCGNEKGAPRLMQESGYMPFGFEDPYVDYINAVRTPWNDVYSYGVILLMLLTKKVDSKELSREIDCDEKILTAWASRQYSGDGCSLVESSLTKDGDYEVSDGIALTKLAMACIRGNVEGNSMRPSAFSIVNRLLELGISKRQELHGILEQF